MRFLVALIILLFIFPVSFSQTLIEPLHGIKIKNIENLDGFIVSASSKTGKIVIRHAIEPAGISMFVMRRSKSKDPVYPLKILSIPFRNGQVFYKMDKNVINALALGRYYDFSTFFDTAFAQDAFIYGWANYPAKGYINIVRGKKYNFVTVFLPSENFPLEALFDIASNIELIKPAVKYKKTAVYSQLIRKEGKPVEAVYVDLPEGYTITGGTVLPQYITETPFFCIENSRSKACMLFVNYQYFAYSDYLLGSMAVAQIFSPVYKRVIQTNLYFRNEAELINYYLRYLGVQTQPEYDLIVDGIYPISQTPIRIFRIKGKNLIGYAHLLVGEVSMPPNGYSINYTGYFVFSYGKDKKDFYKAFGSMLSFLYNPYWVSEITKFSMKEAREELKHQMWMWSEIKKTMDYIYKLHNHSIKEEQVYQEEMARAATNILSDYTYVRDPETGEVFHIEDDAKEYWRDNEGNIVKLFKPEEVDKRLLEVWGWRKMEYRLEGFGQW